ncbi:FAD dependent oxidoreductase [Massarina eburnea CBS 473.64]|uniref:FAD dependent oxidoreductase n=1 Tax=Massarina eburnea CBS 473.64 TaxID=1395130 RepID=A0A6A6S427_9PLEO|nr:FAD dependent oxidoreductase [Massarina eburnea CBS 473.64]
MNDHASASSPAFDCIIIGAGISGINAAYRFQEAFPSGTCAILEGRSELGGTWSLFKYPGIRSDSDLHTFGFPFNPWEKPNPIGDGASIVQYCKDTAAKFGIDRKIRYRHKVVHAEWRSEEQRWRLDVDVEGEGEGVERKVFWANWLIMGTGYYDYDKPLQADIPSLHDFKGTTVHPQFWPEDLDYKGKKVVVIGSGATAITLLPSLTNGGATSVTMLQRSPSYVMSLPQRQVGGPPLWHERIFPKWISLKIERTKSIVIGYLFWLFCQYFPGAGAWLLRSQAKKHLPPGFVMDPHFYPNYNPWEQRLCLCPDADFFKCFETGRAQIVTATIKNVVEDGILLNNGDKLDADIIVTATGLRLSLLGKMSITKDSTPITIPSHFVWRTCMITALPNFGFLMGYVNASWTLGSDTSARLLMRVMKHQKEHGFTSATPEIEDDEKENEELPLGLNSTYFKGAEKIMPKSGGKGAFKKRKNYFVDWWIAGFGSVVDGIVYGRKTV